MTKAPLPVLALLMLSGGFAGQHASAAEGELAIPKFDHNAYCFYASVNSSGVYDRKTCTDEEARSAELVRQQWSRIPREVQITCGEIARQTGQSYFILKACLRNLGRAYWSDWQEDGEILDRSQQIARGFRRN
jgi:hypothetical protein